MLVIFLSDLRGLLGLDFVLCQYYRVTPPHSGLACSLAVSFPLTEITWWCHPPCWWVSRKSVHPKQKIQIKAPGRQGEGEGDRLQPKEQVIKLGFIFWDPGRNQMPLAQKLWYHLNSCEQVESEKVFHFVLNWGTNLTPLLLCRGAPGLFKETHYFKDFSAP